MIRNSSLETGNFMKASVFQTTRIIILSVFYTVVTCSRAIIRSFFGKINREWVDKEMHRWVDNILEQVKVDYQIINPHHVEPKKREPTIIMCNHTSLYDIPLSIKAFPNHSIRMLAKKELSKIPVMGKAMKVAEFPFIDRHNRRQAIEDLKYVQKLLDSGIVMWIAPEGTRSKTGKLASFKKGAFITAIQAKATIIPIGILGAYDILPAKTYQFNISQKAEIRIGQPIDASEYSLEDKEALIDKVHQAMEELLKSSGQ